MSGEFGILRSPFRIEHHYEPPAKQQPILQILSKELNAHTKGHTTSRIYIYIYKYVYTFTDWYICVYISTYTHKCMYVQGIHLQVCVCIYIYKYIFTYLSIYIYTGQIEIAHRLLPVSRTPARRPRRCGCRRGPSSGSAPRPRPGPAAFFWLVDLRLRKRWFG